MCLSEAEAAFLSVCEADCSWREARWPSPRDAHRLRRTQEWSGACFCFKHDKFSTAIKVSVALTSFFVSLAGRACGLLSHKISANNLELILKVSFLVHPDKYFQWGRDLLNLTFSKEINFQFS